MRVLSFDPGARRAGWAVLDPGPTYIASGIEEFPRREGESYQRYRMRLTYFWVARASELLDEYKPEYVVTETVPVYGMNDFSQGYLALVMSVCIHAMTYLRLDGTLIKQVSARSVQKQIAIRGNSKNITKTQVRNGVISLLPELEEQYGKTKVFEATDALAIALFSLGYST